MLDVVAAELEEKLLNAFENGRKLMVNIRSENCVNNSEMIINDFSISNGKCEIINGNSYFIFDVDNIIYDDFDDMYIINSSTSLCFI